MITPQVSQTHRHSVPRSRFHQNTLMCMQIGNIGLQTTEGSTWSDWAAAETCLLTSWQQKLDHDAGFNTCVGREPSATRSRLKHYQELTYKKSFWQSHITSQHFSLYQHLDCFKPHQTWCMKWRGAAHLHIMFTLQKQPCCFYGKIPAAVARISP